MIRLNTLLNEGKTWFIIKDGKVSRLRHDIDIVALKKFPKLTQPAAVVLVNNGYTVSCVNLIEKNLSYVLTASIYMKRDSFSSYKDMVKLLKLFNLIEKLSKQKVRWTISIFDRNLISNVFTGDSTKKLYQLIEKKR